MAAANFSGSFIAIRDDRLSTHRPYLGSEGLTRQRQIIDTVSFTGARMITNMSLPGTSNRSLLPALTGYTACGWALVFGIIHVYWAIGGTVGLQGHSMTGLLYVINLIAIPLCFVAAVVAFALATSPTRLIPRWMWLIVACGASVVLAARGSVGILQNTISQNQVPLLLMAYDMWFLLGGILFGMAAVLNSRK